MPRTLTLSLAKMNTSPFLFPQITEFTVLLRSPHSAVVSTSCKRGHSVCLWRLISLSIVFGIHARCSICQVFLCFLRCFSVSLTDTCLSQLFGMILRSWMLNHTVILFYFFWGGHLFFGGHTILLPCQLHMKVPLPPHLGSRSCLTFGSQQQSKWQEAVPVVLIWID